MKKILSLFNRLFRSPESYARYLGVNIGKNCYIATRNWGSEPYLINIGNNVQITSGVSFHTHGGAHVVRRYCPDFDVFGKINIHDWVYIGAGSRIMPGVTIGENSLIAAGSVVCKSVPPNELWGGVPARYICTIDDYLRKNLPYNVNTKGKSSKEKKEILLSLPPEKFISK